MCLYLLFKIASVKISLQVCMPRVPWSILCNTWLWRFFTNTYFDKGEATYLFFFSFRLSYQKVKFYISTLPYKRQTFLIKTETKGSAFCLFLFSGVLSVLQTWVPKQGSFCCCRVDFFHQNALWWQKLKMARFLQFVCPYIFSFEAFSFTLHFFCVNL